MMRTDSRRVMLRRAALAVVVLSAAAWAGAGKPLADLMPRQTMALVEMPPLKVMWEDFQKNLAPDFVDNDLRSAWTKLWEGKWERELRDIFGVQPLDFVLTYPQRLGCIFGDLGPLVEAAAADKEPAPGMVEIAVCIDAGSGKEEFAKAFEKFLDAGVEYAHKKGEKLALRRENYHGAPYFMLCESDGTESAEKKDPAADMRIYAAWVDTWLVATLSKSLLERILDVREGAPALSANEGYRAAKETIGWKGDEVMLFADVRPFFEFLKKVAAAEAARDAGEAAGAKQRQLVIDILDLLFGEITTLALKGGYADKTAVSEYFIGCDQGAQPGVLHLLGRKEGLSFPAWAWSNDNSVQVSGAMDAKFLQAFVPKLLTAIYKSQFDASMAEAWRTQFSAFFMGVDLEKDILGSIGERLTVVVNTNEPPKAAAKPEGDELELDVGASMSDFLVSLELQKTEPWQTMLGQLNTMARGALQQTDYMDRKFFVFVDMPFMKLLGGVTDGMLLVGTRDMIEQAVRRFGKDLPGLNDDARLRELSAGAAKPNAMIAHAAQGSFGTEQLRELWTLMESGLTDEIKGLQDPIEKELAEGALNLVREVLKEKHWSGITPRSFGTATWEARGLRFRSLERWTKAKAESF